MKIKMGGVPEHFNYPFQKGKETGLFNSLGIDLSWEDCGGGTGQMLEKLENGSLDAAVLLSEGLISGIINGAPIKIVRFYVSSPLIWGLHIGAKSEISAPSQAIETYAISRYKSGSHLMSFVCDAQYHIENKNKTYNIIQNIDGAVQSLSDNPDQYFLWEKFTTQPYVDQGIFKRIGEVPTPWPCFALAVRADLPQEEVQKLNAAMFKAVDLCEKSPQIIEEIAEYYQLRKNQVETWYQNLEWTKHQDIDTSIIEDIIKFLIQAESIKEDHGFQPEDLIYKI